MIDLSNFKTFDFNEGAPYVSVTCNGLTFNKAVIMKMDYPEAARLLIDSDNKLLAVQACGKDEEKAYSFYKPKESRVLSVRWNTKDLVNTVSRLGGWDLKQMSYRVDGIYIPEQSLMLFDLNTATPLI